MVSFREVESGDKKSLNKFLNSNQFDLERMPDVKSDFICLAFDGNKIMGICNIWDNFFHPYRKYVNVFVEKKYRRKGVGKGLYEFSMKGQKGSSLQANVYSDNKPGMKFLASLGFRCVRKSFDYEAIEEDLLFGKEAINLNIVPFSDLSEDEYLSVLRMNYDDYRKTHSTVNPLNEEIDLNGWREYVEQDLCMKSSHAYFENGLPACYAMLTASEDEEIEMMYFGAAENIPVKVQKSFYHNLFLKCFKENESVVFEVDDIDKNGMVITEILEEKPPFSWDTYVL